jgi:outer membrane protein assembly factor BamA
VLNDIFLHVRNGRSNDAALAQALAAIVQHFVEQGFPFAQAQLVAVDITATPFVNFTVAVFPGPVVFAGALRTDARRHPPNLFERSADWRRGAPLTDAALSRAEAGVATLPFVTAIDTAQLPPTSADTSDVFLSVREAAAIRISGAGGWIPATAGREGYWVGQADVQLSSPFGDGRMAELSAARRDPYSRRTQLAYWEPWPFGAPFWAGMSLRQDDVDSNFIETEAALRLRLISGSPRWEGIGSWAKITPEEHPQADVFPARRYSIGVGVSDSGQTGDFRFELRWGRHSLFSRDSLIPPRAQVSHTQGQVSGRYIQPLAPSLYLQFIGKAAGTLAGEGFLPANLLYRVGGAYSLRGYREQQFLVSDYLRLSTELHFGSTRRSVFLFVDAGWLGFSASVDRIAGAAGLGIRPADGVQLLVAVPSDEGLGQTKVHIALSSRR